MSWPQRPATAVQMPSLPYRLHGPSVLVHANTFFHTCSPAPDTHWRWSVGVGKPSPSNTCPRWPPHLRGKQKKYAGALVLSSLSTRRCIQNAWEHNTAHNNQ